MKKKLKLNQLNESELSNKELNALRGGGGCFGSCLSSDKYKRVYIKVVKPTETSVG